eukprot:9957787-Karenia_brevis.AAC.1
MSSADQQQLANALQQLQALQASQEEDEAMASMDLPTFPPRDVVHEADPWAASRSAKTSRGEGGKRAAPAAPVQP